MFSSFTIDIERLPANAVLPDRLGRLYWHFVRQIWPLLLVMTVLSAAVAVLNTLLPWATGLIVDATLKSTAGGRADTLAGLRPALIAAGVLCFGLMPVLGSLSQYLSMIVFSSRFGAMIRRQAHWYTLRHSLSYFQGDFAGRIASKLFELGRAVTETLNQLIGAVVYVAVFFTSSVWLAGRADIRLVVPLLAWLVLYIIILVIFIPRVRVRSDRQTEASSRALGRVVDSYTNIMTVKLFSGRDHEDRFVIDALHRHADENVGLNRQIFFMTALLNIANCTMMAVIAGLCLSLWTHGAITPGAIAMILPLAVQINNQMHWIMWEATGIFSWIGTAQNSMDTLSKPHQVMDNPGAPPLAAACGAVRFKNVSFHYGQERKVIDHLTLHIPAGQKVGLIGHSGAGKSTLVNLLLRFHDLEEGSILVDGQDIACVTQDSLRASIGMVTQDTSLLHRSILDNIRYGRPEAAMEEVIAAAQKAHAHDFILNLTDNSGNKGYDALVGERGVKLSGGQRQRIALARVLLKDAPILILDEATSALDSEVESYIQAHLATLMEGKTVIAIAHRLSTIARMDRLLVMESGRIAEDGSHEELLRRGGDYARLWSLQSGGFLP